MEGKGKQLNFNTVLLTLALGAICYVGKTAMETSNSVARIDATLSSRLASGERMERKLDDISSQVNRQENSITELRSDLNSLKQRTVLTK